MTDQTLFHGFPPESLAFMAGLRKHGTKAWFEARKEVYRRSILEPSRAFVVEMGEHLQALVPGIHAVPKVNGSLFRIYRDSRFHRDEMKDHIGFVFWQGSGKRMQSASFYFHFDAETLFFAAGIRRFKPELLAVYRDTIRDEKSRASLHAILETLRAKGYDLPQPRYKRYPRGFHAGMPHAYLALFDSMYAYTERTPDRAFFTEALPAMAYDIYEEMYALQQWVYDMTRNA
jgi:uncharacterized protein (TIGR02453 family)